jgi:hypothetical protein
MLPLPSARDRCAGTSTTVRHLRRPQCVPHPRDRRAPLRQSEPSGAGRRRGRSITNAKSSTRPCQPGRPWCSHAIAAGRLRHRRAAGGWCFPRSCLQPSGLQLAVQAAASSRPAPPWNRARATFRASLKARAADRRNSAGSGHPLPTCIRLVPPEPFGKQRANSPRMCDENAGGSIETGIAAACLIAEPTWTLCGGGSAIGRAGAGSPVGSGGR